MNNEIRDTLMGIILSNPQEIELDQDEKNQINALPHELIFPILQTMYKYVDDIFLRARVYDALLSIEVLDKVHLLIQLFDEGPKDQRSTHCYELGYFQDKRSSAKLCDILLKDADPNIRYIAATSLANFDDTNVIQALEQAQNNDNQENFEGIPVSQMAKVALHRIHQRNRDEKSIRGYLHDA